MEDTLFWLAADLSYVLLALVALLVAKLIKDAMTPYRIDDQLTARDNHALGLALCGYFGAVIIIFLGATTGDFDLEEPSALGLAESLAIDLLYALGGVVLLNVGRTIVDRFVLPDFCTTKEIIEDKNVGTGAVEAGAFLATGLIIAGAIQGEGGVLSALAFFALGQVTLVLFGRFYQRITKYDIHEEIERDNVAAGVALGLGMVAIGLVLMKAVMGDLVSWSTSLQQFAIYAVVGFVLLLLLRKITDFVFLPESTMAHEIAVDQNLNAAWLEGVIAIGIAAVLFFTI